MQLMIEIPEKLACEGFERSFTEEEKNILIKAIGNGILLPKGHGRLIDGDKFDVISYQHTNDDFDKGVMWLVEQIDNAPTIIEADTADQEPKTEKVIKMHDATPEERESIDKYIKSISKPTGVNFWDLEQEPKTGHWINAKVGRLFPSNDFKCSECGNILDFNGVNCGRGDANFCPNCGAKMVEPQEGSDIE